MMNLEGEMDCPPLPGVGCLMPPGPLSSGQGSPRVRKAWRPAQRQSSFLGFTLQQGIHRPDASARRNASGRNLGVGLEWQLDHMKPVLDEDFVSELANVAERANEVVPLQPPF